MKKIFLLIMLSIPQLTFAFGNFHESELFLVDPKEIVEIEVIGDRSFLSRMYKDEEYIQITTTTEVFKTCLGQPVRYRDMFVKDLKNFVKKAKLKQKLIGLGNPISDTCFHFFMIAE